MLTAAVDAFALDLARLRLGGSASVAGDPSVAKHAAVLRSLAGKVSVLSPLADAATRLTKTPPATTARLLLDLLVRLRQVRSAQAAAASDLVVLQPVERSGPWHGGGHSVLVGLAAEALSRKGPGRDEAFRAAIAEGAASDLRLLDPILRALADSYAALADEVAERALPAFGGTVLGILRNALRLKGGAVDGRRLTSLVMIDPEGSRELLWQAWLEGSVPVRIAALRAAARVYPTEASDAACAALMGKSPAAVRVAAVTVLRELGPTAAGAVPALIRALGDSDYGVRWRAREPLKMQRRAAVPALVTLLEDPRDDLRQQAVWILGDIGPAAADAVTPLVARLHDPHQHIPWNAAAALGRIGPAARAALPALTALKEHPDGRMRVTVAEAIARISGNPASVLPDLITALNDPEIHVRRDAALALGEIGPKAKAAVPALIEALKNRPSNIRHFAAQALGRIGHNAPVIVPLLIAMVSESEWHIRRQAIEALGRFGPRARKALPVLRAVAQERSSYLQEVVGPALLAIGCKALPVR